MAREAFQIAGERIAPGKRGTVEVPVAKLYTHTPLHIPVEVVHGRREGPTLLVCGAIHGDEINGVEIVRRLLRFTGLRYLRGTLIGVPIVNVFGFVHRSRYLPDRRDLNRCFPGSESGSLGARIAHLFRSQIMESATHIVDLHTGAIHRFNLPQVRAELKNDETARMAHAFGAPIILNASLREGTLRAHADSMGIPVVTYEGGEALRFDELAITSGVRGIIRVMRALEMLPVERTKKGTRKRTPPGTEVATASTWVRAEIDGILRPGIKLGQRVNKGQRLAVIADPFGERESPVVSTATGIVIAMNNLPLVNEGEAIYHIARFDEIDEAVRVVEEFRSELEPAYQENTLPSHPWDELLK